MIKDAPRDPFILVLSTYNIRQTVKIDYLSPTELELFKAIKKSLEKQNASIQLDIELVK